MQEMSSNQWQTKLYLHDLPIDVTSVAFTQYSHFSTNCNDQNKQISPKKRKNIIIGGYSNSGEGFYQFGVDDTCNTISINYKSFKNDFHKKFANLQCIGLTDARYTQSYLVQNNKYIVVFSGYHASYNVYDMENDKWMLQKDEKRLDHFPEQSVLINDEIIIESLHNNLFFYYIGNCHITDPILIHRYTLKTKHVSFKGHGMCIIDFIKQESAHAQDESCQAYKLKIVLFGGSRNKDFLSSFLYLDASLSYISDDKKFKLVSLSIDENLIDKKKIELINMNKTTMKKYYDFGYECVLNCKNEPIIIIIRRAEENIHLFNCVTYKLIEHQQVISKFIVCC